MKKTAELMKAQEELMATCKSLQASLERNAQENFKIRVRLQSSKAELLKLLDKVTGGK